MTPPNESNIANSGESGELPPAIIDTLSDYIKGYRGVTEGVQIGDVLWVGDGARAVSEQIASGAMDCVVSIEDHPYAHYLA